MANTEENKENKKLDKTLTINGESYNVNAVYSDKAGQVSNNLVLNVTGTSNPVNFNGSAKVEVDVVSPSGGNFTGPVFAESSLTNNNIESIDPKAVLNAQDLFAIISTLTGMPVWEWSMSTDGYVLRPITITVPASQEANNESESDISFNGADNTAAGMARMDIIIGQSTSLDALINAINAAEISGVNYFIYLCSDTGNVYFKFKDYNNDAVIALSAKTADVATSLQDENGNTFYDTNTIQTLLGNIAEIQTFLYGGENITNNIYDSESLKQTINNLQAKLTEEITKAIKAVIDGEDTDGNTLTVENATNATNANYANSANNATNLGGNSADWYQKKITISNLSPASTDGVKGDIWIVYSST